MILSRTAPGSISIYLLAFALMVSLGVVFSLTAIAQDFKPQSGANQPQESKDTETPKYTKEQILETWGWVFAHRMRISECQFTQAEIQELVLGMSGATEGKPIGNYANIKAQVDAYIEKRHKEGLVLLKARSQKETEAFFAEIKKKPGVQMLPSGLAYEILQPGQGPPPKPDQLVTIQVTGTLVDGTIFDSTASRGKPYEVKLSATMPGWLEGLQEINKGGKIKLYIPPQLACGDLGGPEIPPFSTLICEMELLDVKDAPR